MKTYTPGPWRVEDRSLTAQSYRVRHLVSDHGVSLAVFTETKATEDDARLIAAAPELLEALKGCVGYLAGLPRAYRPDDAWFKPAFAAIAKAEGTE